VGEEDCGELGGVERRAGPTGPEEGPRAGVEEELRPPELDPRPGREPELAGHDEPRPGRAEELHVPHGLRC